MTWLELSIEVDPEAVEPVSELLAQYGYNGGVAVDQPIIPGIDGPEYTYDTSRPVTLRTYLPLDQHAEEVRGRVEHALWHLGQIRPLGPLLVRSIEEQDWANAWKQHYTIQRVGERTVIVPSWLEYTPQAGDIVLRLDPGMAFGTGLHPTTQLCLQLLERYVNQNKSILDLGCGSGILAIAAAQLSGNRVLALDTDPIAVAAAHENIVRNGLTDRVHVAEGSLGGGTTIGHWLGWEAPLSQPPQALTEGCIHQYDLIVANIIARVLATLATDLAEALVANGILISSGIIAEREHEVVEAFAAAGLLPIERRQEGDWVALVHRKTQ